MNKAMREFYADALEKRLFSAKSKTMLALDGAVHHIVSGENEERASCFCGMLCDPGIYTKWDMPAKECNLCPDCVRAYSKVFMQAKSFKYAELIYALEKQADTSPLGMALIAMLVRWHEIRSKKKMHARRKHELQKGNHKRARKNTPNGK